MKLLKDSFIEAEKREQEKQTKLQEELVEIEKQHGNNLQLLDEPYFERGRKAQDGAAAATREGAGGTGRGGGPPGCWGGEGRLSIHPTRSIA